MIFKEEKKVDYTPKQSVKSNAQANGDVVSKEHNKENIMDFDKNLQELGSYENVYDNKTDDVITPMQAAMNLQNTLFGDMSRGPREGYIARTICITHGNVANNVATSLMLKEATGRTSDTIRGKTSNSKDENLKMFAPLIEEKAFLKSQKRFDPEKSKLLSELMATLATMPTLKGSGDELMLSKAENSREYGTKELLKDNQTAKFVVKLIFDYNSNADIAGKESAELALAQKVISACTKKLTNEDGTVSFVTDHKLAAKIFDKLTNFYIGLVVNSLVSTDIEGLTRKNVNAEKNPLIRTVNSNAYNEHLTQKKDSSIKYSLFRSLFLKTLRDLFAKNSVKLYSSNVVLDIGDDDLFKMVLEEKEGRIVVASKGLIARYISNYSNTKLAYLMANTTTDICGWVGLGYDVRMKAYAELEAAEYAMPEPNDKGNIVITSYSDLKDFAIYNYFNQPLSKGEMIGALSHIFMTRNILRVHSEAKENGAPEAAAIEMAIEWVQNNVFCYSAFKVDPTLYRNHLQAQEVINGFFSNSVKKLPEITVAGHKALFIRKFKEQGVQKALMVKLPEDYNSGLLSNYASISVGLNKFTAEILGKALSRGVSVYVQEVELTTSNMVKETPKKSNDSDIIVGR